MSHNQLRYSALGGVVGPLVFTMIFIICASLRPGYSHVHQLISELGATGTSHAKLMNFAGFIPSGVMISVFGLSQALLLPKNTFMHIGSVLIVLFGLGVATAGVFTCDEGCPPQGSFEHMLHFRVSGPAFLCAYAGILMLAISFREFHSWKGFWIYSLISALLALGFNIALINSLASRSFSGLWQRLMLLTIFLWCGIVGLRIFRLEKAQTGNLKIRPQKSNKF